MKEEVFQKEDARLYEEVGVEELARHVTDEDFLGPEGFLGDGGTHDRVVLGERVGPVMHRDIGEIEPTELDGVTIHRTRNKVSPFVPIIKTPNYAENSGNLTGYSVEIEDPESKTGFRHLGNVSPSYLLLTNEEIRALAVEVAVQSGLPFRESRVFWDGTKFAHVIDFVETSEAVDDGDEVGLSLITRSSYDKSWRYETALMGTRFLCDNGALSGEFFARVSFKHLKGSSEEAESWKEIVRQGLSVIDRAPESLHRFVEGLRLLKRMETTDERLREVWKLVPELGPGVMGKVLDRYVRFEEPTLYGLLNAGTNVFYHNPKMTAADFANNDALTTGLLKYAFDRRN